MVKIHSLRANVPGQLTDKGLIKTLRVQIEADIGILKNANYGFNRPGERKEPDLAVTGTHAILSRKFNQLM